MKTIWDNIKLDSYPSLNKDLDTEVLVIGGGICGILCAHRLSKLGKKVVLIEKDRLASKRTGKTTAVATALQDIYYSDLRRTIGPNKAKMFLDANLEAINEYKRLSYIYNFDCEESKSYKYFSNEALLEKELSFLKEMGYSAKESTDFEFQKGIKALEFSNQLQFNPLMLIKELVKHFTIYENTEIINLKEGQAFTKNYTIKAKHIIVATGYPFLRFKGHFFMRLTQNKSYVMTIENNSKQISNGVGELPSDLYFRTYKNHLIIGGSDQKTGRYYKGFSPIKKYLKAHYNDSHIEYSWVNQDCVSADGLPYIGRYGNFKNIYVATGFNLWGMTGSMISSMVLADLIDKQANRYAGLFTPKRRTPFLKLMNNILVATINMLTLRKRCGHLGCGLYYNDIEEVYECPCHGTKYSKDGKLIFNPAKHNK